MHYIRADTQLPYRLCGYDGSNWHGDSNTPRPTLQQHGDAVVSYMMLVGLVSRTVVLDYITQLVVSFQRFSKLSVKVVATPSLTILLKARGKDDAVNYTSHTLQKCEPR